MMDGVMFDGECRSETERVARRAYRSARWSLVKHAARCLWAAIRG
jgi:hypothetical protein